MSILSEMIAPAAELIGKFIPDKDKANQLAHEIATMGEKYAHQEVMAQLEVNKVEAAHPSIFVSGWRPFIGWVCGIAMVFNFMLVPVLNIWLPITPVDWAQISPILIGMLGFGGMRTFEKVKKVAREK